MTPEKIVIAFDLYGTLLSTESISHELAKHFGVDNAKSIAALWRRYQLEYTWRSNSMGTYKNFGEITRSSLSHALAENGLSVSTAEADSLMKAYDALHVFPDVPGALKSIQAASDSVDVYVFSNGTDEMVGNSVKTSPDLSPYSSLFKSLITVDELGVYKPHPKVYEDLLLKTGKQGKGGEVWLVSGNPFDVVGAQTAGLNAAWIDRAGKGWIDRLDETKKPNIVASGVDEAVKTILASQGRSR